MENPRNNMNRTVERTNSQFNIQKIMLGNDGEPDELYIKRGNCNSNVIFCDKLIEKINNFNMNSTDRKVRELHSHVPTRREVFNFLLSNLHKFEIHES